VESLARRERYALCDLALSVGPGAPTLCGEWDASDLVAHLLVREHSPSGAPGIGVKALAGLTERAMRREQRRPFPEMVERLREPGWTPYALPWVERLANTLEFVVHHEDLRRAQPDWSPRALAPEDDQELWKAVCRGGRLLVRTAKLPVRLRHESRDGQEAVLRSGADPVTVIGSALELVLFLFGRQRVARVELDGSPDRVERLRAASLGF
jgi:uncharacterized protein (TIGR03085 family)